MYSKELIKRTKAEFQEYQEKPITDEETSEIITNFTGFAKLLLRWDAEQNNKCINHTKT